MLKLGLVRHPGDFSKLYMQFADALLPNPEFARERTRCRLILGRCLNKIQIFLPTPPSHKLNVLCYIRLFLENVRPAGLDAAVIYPAGLEPLYQYI